MTDATIIGAGIAGLWVAHALTERGLSVRLIDQNGAPGPHGCSWWAGGMLAPFCEGATAEPVITRLGQQALTLWPQVSPVTVAGSLVVALDRDRAELDRFARRTSGHEWLDADHIAGLEPQLAHKRALFFADEGHVNPREALADLVCALSDAGVPIERGAAQPDDLTGTVIDARGMASAAPGLRGVRGEMVILNAPDIVLSRPIRLLHPRHPLYIVPRGDGVYMLGATQIESGARGPITARSMLELLSAAYALDPRFAEGEVIETGTDLRPAFADNIPRVIVRGRVLHVNGLFRHGYLMAPVLAQQVADYLTTRSKGELIHED
ncbi:FAD-dependent oxidoreductase [Paracoccus sp. (in: a-proteobacteria)]|uniref:FAD-dependent oxidoreductase n=1 Tax=Paracoccus sp. TaxID=267 RepID=UPI0026DEAA42|nr:FAD-dependent oxidoreductase [Paracoccus sp. (in: a-proteobacteria)]MDO5647115.1 FAD-dependent oxidoreductase [Paracoccus sp. (in: a-proteobacteria)]